MKTFLSEEGSVELGLGLVLAVAGVAYYAFPGQEAGPSASGAMFSVGVILICYGYGLRKASNARTRREVVEFERRRS